MKNLMLCAEMSLVSSMHLFLMKKRLRYFLDKVLEHNIDNENIARRMLNNVMQMMKLADDIDIIRPDRDPLRVFFMRTCQEAIYRLYNDNTNSDKINIKDFFTEFFPKQGRIYVLSSFIFKEVDYNRAPDYINKKYIDDKAWYEMDIDDFSLLFFKIRGMVTHEGDFWSVK